jgi:hypothetical protein
LDVDLGTLLLKRLTVQEAGRLGSTCLNANTLVQRGEIYLNVGDVVTGFLLEFSPAQEMAMLHAMFLSMWNIERVLDRLERYRQPFFASGGLQFRETSSLARLLVTELLPAGVIDMHFNLRAARSGRKPSLLGCHTLRVLDPLRWVQRLRDWALNETLSLDDMFNGVHMRQTRRKHPGAYMLDLLHDLGLKLTASNPALFTPVTLPAEVFDCGQLCSLMWVVA